MLWEQPTNLKAKQNKQTPSTQGLHFEPSTRVRNIYKAESDPVPAYPAAGRGRALPLVLAAVLLSTVTGPDLGSAITSTSRKALAGLLWCTTHPEARCTDRAWFRRDGNGSHPACCCDAPGQCCGQGVPHHTAHTDPPRSWLHGGIVLERRRVDGGFPFWHFQEVPEDAAESRVRSPEPTSLLQGRAGSTASAKHPGTLPPLPHFPPTSGTLFLPCKSRQSVFTAQPGCHPTLSAAAHYIPH